MGTMDPEALAFATAAHEGLQPVSPIESGLSWLTERGIDADQVAGVQLRGPKGFCVGTFAEMLGTPGHEQWLGQFDTSIAEAKEEAEAQGRAFNPTDAIMPWVRMSAMRGEDNKIMKVDLETLKKNGGTAGEGSPA